jgi:hypothetical protein
MMRNKHYRILTSRFLRSLRQMKLPGFDASKKEDRRQKTEAGMGAESRRRNPVVSPEKWRRQNPVVHFAGAARRKLGFRACFAGAMRVLSRAFRSATRRVTGRRRSE